jgi:nucleotide-binding universal stress UspA family protein
MNKNLFPPNKILVPTDFGQASRVAMGFARIMHEAFGTAVEVLHACHMELPPYFSTGQIAALKREIKQSTQAAEGLVHKEIETKLGFEAKTAILHQPPLEAILEESERTGAELVIMGTHGRQGARRLVLGTVAEQILKQSQIPVLAVRETAKPVRFRHVFVPFNFSSIGRIALEYAAEMAAASAGLLTIMHARENSDQMSVRELCEGAIRKKCRVEEIVMEGEAAKSILEATQKTKPDVIVMGSERKSSLLGELFSSTTERVMQLADVPLLVVPKN